jgi:DNA repair protein RadC
MKNQNSSILIGNQVAEVRISYSQKIKTKDRITVKSKQVAANLFRVTWDSNRIELQETFRVMLLNRKNELLGISTIGEGGITGCMVDIRLIFAIALKSASVAIILAHNHPSGNLKVSREDIDLSKKIFEAGKLLEIHVLDHLIITREGFLSIDEETDFNSRINMRASLQD